MKKPILFALPFFLFWGNKMATAQVNCSATASFAVAVLEKPTAQFSFTDFGLTLVFQNGSANSTSYFWDFGDGQTSTEANPAHTFSAEGQYNVVLTASNNCGTAVFQLPILVKAVAAAEADGAAKIELSPNPSDGLFSLKMVGKPVDFAQIRIFDPIGRVVFFKKTPFLEGKFSTEIDLREHAAGVYLLEIEDGAGSVFSQKILLKKG